MVFYDKIYFKVRFGGSSEKWRKFTAGKAKWSKRTKASGKINVIKVYTSNNVKHSYLLCCNDFDFCVHYGDLQAELDRAGKLYSKHVDDISEAYLAKYAPRFQLSMTKSETDLKVT